LPWWSLLLTAAVALAVGWFGRQATIGSARVAADVEKQKLEHEQDKHEAERRDLAREDVLAATDAMAIVGLVDASLEARKHQARAARRALLSARWILDPSLGGDRLETFVEALGRAETEADLDALAHQWPGVERELRRDARSSGRHG